MFEILLLNILILGLIILCGFYYFQNSSKKKLEQEIKDQNIEITKNEEINQLKNDLIAEKGNKKTSIDKFEETGELPEGVETDAFSSEIIDILRKKLAVSEEKRRKLHNQLQT